MFWVINVARVPCGFFYTIIEQLINLKYQVISTLHPLVVNLSVHNEN